MKDSYRSIGLVRFCRLFGVTRQAFYQHFWSIEDLSIEQHLVIDKVKELRQLHPVLGGRKLYCLLQPFLLEHQIKIGRDALFDLLAANNLLVRKRKRKIFTTQSNHWFKKYPNLIKTWHPQGPQQLWVADITYVAADNNFLYLSLITDAYSHRIMGYHLAENLEAIHTTKALQMALKQAAVPLKLIHHSDRGIQYCSAQYVKLLQDNNIEISMTESGDPLENPIAERVNGIIKNEYLNHYHLNNQSQAMELLESIVTRYNTQRPHHSINLNTPEIVHNYNLKVNRRWGKQNRILNIVNQYQD